jgi:hypothetical protein
VDVGGQGNKLAASVARELIDIGVHCVVVAGWAVDDQGARRFGESFYEELLLRRRPFGEAVFQARKTVYEANPADITWGAFQAYGDPAWRAEPRAQGAVTDASAPYASPEELLDDLARIRAELSRRSALMNERDLRTQAAALEALLKKRTQPGWLQTPGLQSALGATWLDLGQFDNARAALLAAVQSEDREGTVPIHDLERLANVEARLGERQASADAAPPGQPGPTGEALIRLAIGRLQTLDRLVAAEGGSLHNPERSALLGSAYKRLASVQARAVLLAGQAKARQDASAAMRDSLQHSIEAYGRDEGHPGTGHFDSYLALNRLALLSLLPDAGDRAQAIALARHCRHEAEAHYAREADLWSAVMQSEAALVEAMLDGSLGRAGEAGDTALDALAGSYGATLVNLTLKPGQLDSVVTQLQLLSRFCDALWLGGGDAALYRLAGRLIELGQRIRPGLRARSDRPAPPASTTPARAKATARKTSKRAKPRGKRAAS